jgi:hypothetical protein
VGENVLIPSVSIALQGPCLSAETPPAYQVSVGSRVISLFGRVDFLVDYRSLRLYRAQAEDVNGILRHWGRSGDLEGSVHQLTELEGSYAVVVEEQDQATFLYLSNDCHFLLYYAQRDNNLYLSTDWVKVLQWLGRVEVSQRDLGLFMSREWTEFTRTLFVGLHLLQPYGLYQIKPGELSLLKFVFPGLHSADRDEYDVSQYVSALGAYTEHYKNFALAFSGGTDSRVLACAYETKLDQLLTITYQPPYVSYLRYQSGQSSQKLAQARGLTYTPVTVDWTDAETLTPYVEHYATANPFSIHLNPHYYHMATRIDPKADALLIGTFSDIIWGWGLNQIYFSEKQSHSTSAHSFRLEVSRMFKRGGPRGVASYAVNRYAVRWAMVKSFNKPRFRSLINHYQPFPSQFEELWRYPYKLFALRRYVEWSPAAETTLWSRISEYVDKPMILPFTSPLALHVSSQIPRHNMFDLKESLRGIYGEFDSSAQDRGPLYPPEQKQKPYAAPIFHQPGIVEWNQQFVNAHSRQPFLLEDLPQRKPRAGYYHLHLKHLFQHVEERMAVRA